MPTTVYRVEPRESPNALAGDVSNFVTPDGVWDLSSFRVQFSATVTGAANKCSLPRGLAGLIDALAVYVDDIELQHIAKYGQLARILGDYDAPSYNSDVLDNTTMISDSISSIQYNVTNQPCCISSFHGLLGSGATIKGSIRVQIFWAPNTVLVRDAASSTYALSGLHAVIKNGDPDNITKVVKFENWASGFQRNQSYNQQTPVSVNSQSIDGVVATFLAADFDTAVSTGGVGGTSRYYAHGTVTPATDFGISAMFTVNGNPLSAGHIGYSFAPEYLGDLFAGARSIPFPVALCRDGSVAVRTLSEVLAYQWCAGVPIKIKGNDKTVVVSFNTTGTTAAANFSMVFIKYTSTLELSDDVYTLTP